MIKNKFLLNTIIILLIIIVSTTGCINKDIKNNEQDEKASIILTIKSGEYQTNYTLKDIETIDYYSGTGGYIKTKLLPESVVISEIHEFTGIRITSVLEKIPDLPINYNISVISDDGWTTNYTKDEILGFVDVYNETGDILYNESAVMILAYKIDSKYFSDIDPDNEIGPLKIAFVGDNTITSSNLWAKMVISIEIIS